MKQLAEHVAIAASTVFVIADREKPLGPRLNHAEIETLLERTGLDSKMKVTGLWADWAAGRRGRDR